MVKIFILRMIHGIFALYFLTCLAYIYYAGITGIRNDILLVAAVISLGLEGFAVFVINRGDCPLIHIQRKLGDDKPFFELFFSKSIAQKAIPVFAILTWVGLGVLILGLIVGMFSL